MDLYELKLDFNLFVEYLEKIYQITQSNFDYHIFYEDSNANKEYSHYITLDNGIYVEIKTCSKTKFETDVIDMDDTKISSVIGYSSQENNKKLIKFMNNVNLFVIKNKKEKSNV
jgi:hypothetical protein